MSDNRYAPPAAPIAEVHRAPAPGRRDRLLRRFFAATLLVGGVCGMALGVYMLVNFLQQGLATIAFVCALIALFAWASWVGLRLWAGTPFGRRWAVVAFATQVPIITVPGVQLGWFTGITLAPMITSEAGELGMSINANLGANGTFYLGAGATQIAVGANLFALFAVIMLVKGNRRAAEHGPA